MDQSEAGVRPTPETRRKARIDEIGLLQRIRIKGLPFLWPEHAAAAHDIEAGHRLIVQPCEMRLSDPSAPSGRHQYAWETDEDYNPRDKKLYRGYRNWIAGLRGTRGLHDLTLDIVVHGLRLVQCERRYQLVPGQGKYRLRESLGVYCTANGKLM